jgi:hypothetical protein
MSDDEKDPTNGKDKVAWDHLFVGAREPGAPPPKVIKKKRRKAGAQHDAGWADWPKDEPPR